MLVAFWAFSVIAGPASAEEVFPLLRRHQVEAAPAEPPQEEDLAPPQPAPVKEAKAFAARLPPVATVLTSATKTMNVLGSEVSQLQARLLSIQQHDQQKLAAKKADFERRLDEQEQKSHEVDLTNARISNEITALQTRNTNARQAAVSLQQENRLMRKELEDIQAKLTTARQFVVASLGHTDDSHAKELTVLQVSTQPVTHSLQKKALVPHVKAVASSDDDDDDEDDDKEDTTSFLELSAQAQPASDGESFSLLTTLKKGLAELANEEKRGSEQLDKDFHMQFQAGRVKRARLLTKQRALNATRLSLRAEGGKLDTANVHLEKTHKHLEHRLHAVGVYLQRLAHLVLAPAKESEGLIAQMPKAVPLQ